MLNPWSPCGSWLLGCSCAGGRAALLRPLMIDLRSKVRIVHPRVQVYLHVGWVDGVTVVKVTAVCQHRPIPSRPHSPLQTNPPSPPPPVAEVNICAPLLPGGHGAALVFWRSMNSGRPYDNIAEICGRHLKGVLVSSNPPRECSRGWPTKKTLQTRNGDSMLMHRRERSALDARSMEQGLCRQHTNFTRPNVARGGCTRSPTW